MIATAGIDIDVLRQWVGRGEVREQHIDPFPARALAGLLDRTDAPGEGDVLPVAWHWFYCLDAPSCAGTGVDGHPRHGGFLTPVPLPRRMWAAGEMELHEPMRLGSVARKISMVRSVEIKQGKAGARVFVIVAHEFEQYGKPHLNELQHIVYREAPTSPAPPPPGETAPSEAAWQCSLQPDPVMPFRFSALTYNGHRIHYDHDYAIRDEFYPALVVHGPLLATLFWICWRVRAARPHCPRTSVSRPIVWPSTPSLCSSAAAPRPRSRRFGPRMHPAWWA